MSSINEQSWMNIKKKLGITYSLCTYRYPDKIFNNVDFPQPEGPMIAVNSPPRNSPLTPFSMVFETADNYKILY